MISSQLRGKHRTNTNTHNYWDSNPQTVADALAPHVSRSSLREDTWEFFFRSFALHNQELSFLIIDGEYPLLHHIHHSSSTFAGLTNLQRTFKSVDFLLSGLVRGRNIGKTESKIYILWTLFSYVHFHFYRICSTRLNVSMASMIYLLIYLVVAFYETFERGSSYFLVIFGIKDMSLQRKIGANASIFRHSFVSRPNSV